jgi:DNA-binding transcriptional MerR regulator
MGHENKPTASARVVPEWAIHISKVYSWGEKPRRFGNKITKRTIQWYSSSGMIPQATRIGKEAYYNKYEIFAYLRVIELLNRKFGLLLSQIRRTILAVKRITEEGSGGIVQDVDQNGEPVTIPPINALEEFLEEYLEYEDQEASKCETSGSEPNWSNEQASRLQSMEREIKERLLGKDKVLEDLLTGGVIQLEEELFPKGKGTS